MLRALCDTLCPPPPAPLRLSLSQFVSPSSQISECFRKCLWNETVLAIPLQSCTALINRKDQVSAPYFIYTCLYILQHLTFSRCLPAAMLFSTCYLLELLSSLAQPCEVGILFYFFNLHYIDEEIEAQRVKYLAQGHSTELASSAAEVKCRI